MCNHLSLPGKYREGCNAFERISHNVGRDESNIKEDQETLDEQTYTEVGVAGGVCVMNNIFTHTPICCVIAMILSLHIFN